MRKIALTLGFIFAFIALRPLLAQLKEERNLPAFNTLKNMGSMRVVLQKGETESARIESEKTELNKIVTEVSGGELKIHFKPRVKVQIGIGKDYESRGQVTVYITYKQLKGVSNSGSGVIECDETLQAQTFEARQSGSGIIKLAGIDIAQNAEATVSGSGKIYIKSAKIGGNFQTKMSGSGKLEIFGGAVKMFDTKVSGSGKIDCAELEAENAEAKVSGSGKVYVAVVNHLEAKISGSGKIYYKTKPASISADISGSGRVRAMEKAK